MFSNAVSNEFRNSSDRDCPQTDLSLAGHQIERCHLSFTAASRDRVRLLVGSVRCLV